MNRRFISKAVVAAIFVGSWGCNDAVKGDVRTTDDTGVFSTDSTTVSYEDTGTDTQGTLDSDVVLGTDDPQFSYEGFEDEYILTDDDDPTDVCRVRYELHAVAEPAVPCTICEWDVVMEKQHPSVLFDVDNACENSDLHLDEAAIAARVGERVAYGFARESVGHANILMRFNLESGRWEQYTVSNWDSTLSTLRYQRRDGMCAYAGADETDPSTTGICGLSGEAIVTKLTNLNQK
jgi:hypothetical protein